MKNDIIEKIKKSIRDEGILAFLKKSFTFILSKVYYKFYVYQTSITEPINEIPIPIKLDFKWANADDINDLDEMLYVFSQKDKEFTINQLKNGAKCFFALHEGEVVGYSFARFDKLEVSKYCLNLPQDKVYRFNTFVLKKWRGKRLLNAIESHGSADLRAIGKKFIIGFIHKDNKASIKGRERMGWKRIGEFYSIRFFGERPLFEFNYMPKKVKMILASSLN